MSKMKIKSWSGWLTAISSLSMVLLQSVVTDIVSVLGHLYWIQGLYGSIFEIIAGALRIAAANSKRLSRTKCL